MRNIGPNEASLRILDGSAGAGRGESLKAGAFVSAQIRERLGPGLFSIAIGGRLFVASSAKPLEPGSILKARIERQGGEIILRASAGGFSPAEARVLSRVSAAALFSDAGLPADAASFSALAALLREGVAPESRALGRVRRAALLDSGDRTELAARMEAKGIPAEGDALEGLLREYSGVQSEGRRGATGGRDFGDRGEADRERLHEGGEFDDLGRDIERIVPEPELRRVLAALLRDLATRSGAGSPGGEGESLALFNHLRGPEGSWVIVPFRFALDAVDFAGSFRIQLPYARGGAGFLEARFSASRGAFREEWAVDLGFGGGRASVLRIKPPEGRESCLAGSAFDALGAELAALSCSVRGALRDEEGETGRGGLDLDA
jgi:hypothetical protein